MMRRICYCLAIVAVMLVCVPFGAAQASFDLNLGFGSARAGSNGGGIDDTTFSACIPSPATPTCLANPSLNGVFMGFGGDLMLYKHVGVGAEVAFKPALSDYGPLKYRQTFYDINGIVAPVNEKRVQLQVQGGIGAAKTGFTINQSFCVGTAICQSVSQSAGSATHFQVHAGVGLQLFVTEHIFIRPQFDLHYVPNFTDQFGRNSVPAAMIWVGYSFGDRS